MKTATYVLAVAFGLIALLHPSAARADTITAASFSAQADEGVPISTPGTVTGSACNGGDCQTSTASVSYSNGASSASASGSMLGTNPPNMGSVGTVAYYFEIVGPANVQVPLELIASGTTSATGSDTESLAYVQWGGGQLYACSATGDQAADCVVAGVTLPASFSGTQDWDFVSNGLSSVVTTAGCFGGIGPATCSASINDTLIIDPSFAEASEFTLEFSPNPTTTPEPSSFLLLGGGLLALLGARKYKRLAT